MGQKTNTQLWEEIRKLRALTKLQAETIEKQRKIIEGYESKEGLDEKKNKH